MSLNFQNIGEYLAIWNQATKSLFYLHESAI